MEKKNISSFNKNIEPSPDRINFWVQWAKDNPENVGRMLALKEVQAERDSLTGLLNRQGFEKHAEARISELKRSGETFSFLFGDLNGLKKINDTEGHGAGDNFLITVANATINSIRKSDIVARWGGDEIIVLLPGQHKEQALEVVGRINNAMINGYSVSFGVGEWDGIKNLETLMTETDEMMNQIKHAGLGAGERSSGVDLVELD
jgi:diguanylate cyclase (GGDEF)-like protein